jgi:surface antigen
VRRILVACTVLGIGLAGAARAAPPCFWPEEIEADQAVRLQTELMLVGETCREPGYARFLERNRDALAAYQEILLERFGRERGGEAAEGALQSYMTRLANEASLRAGRNAAFCAESADLVATVKGMQSNELRVYAAAQATAARPGYPVCAEVAPVTRVALAPPPTPPVPPAAGADEDGLLAGLADDPIARRLDPADRRQIRETTQRALEAAPSGQALAWRNQFSRSGGTVMVTHTFREGGRWCRNFEQSVSVDGETRRERGTACRRPDGLAWDITP